MKNPVSIFIMDVSNSTSNSNWNNISSYLDQVEDWIKEWVSPVGKSIVKHRRGDEIIFVSEHYFTAYIVACTLTHLWKYPEHKPYFGMSFGIIDKEIDAINIETWNHPLVKLARDANEIIKQSNNRIPILFHLQRDYLIDNNSDFSGNNKCFMEMENSLNLLLELQHNLMNNQTDNQRLIRSLYFIYGQQKLVASLVNKSPATISSHYKKGNTGLIFKTQTQIEQNLNSFQESYWENDVSRLSNKLNEVIKDIISKNVKEFILLHDQGGDN
ncbi:hypothetical protein [Evansella tamaricis]|uniref:Uncharacterized protein n=1 Tax=Evansella tamaricis TaxID=2069301 RepID=A0ABS6JFN1_9BACI|nr:hypothetical protein [Evansella tamaricis]MBU9712029.1 hypothetical protein [Evansella tamaricis]